MSGTEGLPTAPSPVGADGRHSGLVHLSTSDTIKLDPSLMRTRRMRHATITGARLLQEQVTEGGYRTYPVMVTLTYAMLGNWSKRHITAYLKRCREWFRRRGHSFHYCWVAELQKRGAVHYHVMIWMPKKLRLPKPDRSGWWPYGMSRVEKARNAVGYLAKYVSKESLDQKFPRGLRLHGRGGLSESSKIEMRWWAAPVWVRRWRKRITDIRRSEGGGFFCVDTGEWRPSPYEVIRINGVLCLREKIP